MEDVTEKLIEEALEGRPRASELARMVQALEERVTVIRRDLDVAPDDADLKAKLKALDQQVGALREEMAITDFVESSVRAAARRPRPVSDEDEDWYG